MGNLLYCLRLGPESRGDTSDPVMVLDNFSIISRQAADSPDLNTFSIKFRAEESGAS